MECSIQLDIEGIFHIKNHVNILALAVYKHSLFAQAVGVHGLMLMPDTEHHQKYKTTQFGPKCGLFFLLLVTALLLPRKFEESNMK